MHIVVERTWPSRTHRRMHKGEGEEEPCRVPEGGLDYKGTISNSQVVSSVEFQDPLVPIKPTQIYE